VKHGSFTIYRVQKLPLSIPTMAPNTRAAWRNVHIFDPEDPKDPKEEIGGLLATNGITNANFYTMVFIICIFESDFLLRDEGGNVVQNDDSPLQPGNYYVHGRRYIMSLFVN
jgi:hypothetical protein